jgi:hypothetical protein
MQHLWYDSIYEQYFWKEPGIKQHWKNKTDKNMGPQLKTVGITSVFYVSFNICSPLCEAAACIYDPVTPTIK